MEGNPKVGEKEMNISSMRLVPRWERPLLAIAASVAIHAVLLLCLIAAPELTVCAVMLGLMVLGMTA